MCNKLHGNFKHIKKTGFGYKLFSYNYNPKARIHYYRPMFPDGKESFKSEEINKWEPKFNRRGDGFCFFLTKKGAEKYQKNYLCFRERTLRKIKYYKGLGKCRHGSGTYSICKEFQILEEV